MIKRFRKSKRGNAEADQGLISEEGADLRIEEISDETQAVDLARSDEDSVEDSDAKRKIARDEEAAFAGDNALEESAEDESADDQEMSDGDPSDDTGVVSGAERESRKNRARNKAHVERARNKKRPKARAHKSRHRVLRNYILAFSLGWAVILCGYGLGYVDMVRQLGEIIGFWQILVFLSLIFVPIVALWLPFVILDGKNGTRAIALEHNAEEINALKREVADVKSAVNHMSLAQEKLIVELIPLIGTQASNNIRDRAKRDSHDQDNLDLPLSSKSAQRDVTLDDLSHVLNFADRDTPGDWANAFAAVQDNGQYLEFVRMAESVLEVFEQEGIFVEDISLRTGTARVWREFAKGVRGDEVVSLEGVRDPSVLALIRARLRNDPEFHDLALRYQKRFIEVLEQLADDTVDVDFVTLNRSRGGRLFVILGALSGIFR